MSPSNSYRRGLKCEECGKPRVDWSLRFCGRCRLVRNNAYEKKTTRSPWVELEDGTMARTVTTGDYAG